LLLYYHKLSPEKYKDFLSENRHDSITKERFKSWDKIVICDRC